ncbi:hypothetical protein [Ancylobacter amanitiformis]|uniref:HIRAN domain-containing protein n=1 Tax=Ancylobacter amanitiformis TaxID=217069 RepID=A0ABU0LUG4_9HYPH|nr:hypothetical protein [Ancylobacter amanitiformis]MDQ0512351.1 hypothetical protein [Ancylobacter amanitiformis]
MSAELLSRIEHMTLLALVIVAAVVLIVVLRLLGRRSVAPQASQTLQGDGGYDYPVAGADDHQAVLGRIAGRHVPAEGTDCTAELLPDVSRAGELRAIWVTVEGARIGHIAPLEVPHFNAALDGRAARCEAVVVASKMGRLSVKLDTVWPPRLD